MDSLTALVAWPTAPFTESLVRKALATIDITPSITSSVPNSFTNLLQWSTYDEIDHELTHMHRETVLSSSYTFRKALIRKHFLSRCIHSYLTKHGDSPLKNAVPQTWELELSFADELDEMWGDELWELGAGLDDPGKWWILKPGMADRGMGIRLFNSKAALQKIFEEFEEGDSEDEQEDSSTSVVTSQLRHFVIQEYLSDPLLLDPSQVSPDKFSRSRDLQGHKFHLRAYCVSSGALSLYLYSRILALFSAVPYVTPVARDDHSPVDLAPHLTNTSLHTHRGEAGVRLLDELVGCHIFSNPAENPNDKLMLMAIDVETLVVQIVNILAETFKAALENPIHFQPLPNAFELLGVDFLVTHSPSVSPTTPSFQVKLLEINAEPAVELTGARLSWILEDLYVAVGKTCVEPFFTGSDGTMNKTWIVGETRHGLVKCLDEEVRGPGGRCGSADTCGWQKLER